MGRISPWWEAFHTELRGLDFISPAVWEPLTITEQKVAFLENDESGPGL